MGKSNYRGESYGKKVARLEFWRDSISDRFYKKGERIVVLASAFGGDVACLAGHGIPQENIVAVDRDEEALAVFSEKWPGVDARLGDIADVVEEMSIKPCCVFLDFCGSLSTTMMETSIRVMRRIKLGGVLGIAFLRAREADLGKKLNWLEPELFSRRERSTFLANSSDDLFNGSYSSFVRKLLEKNNNDKLIRRRDSKQIHGSIARMGAIMRALCRVYEDRVVYPLMVCSYNSGGKKKKGSPMGIASFRVAKRVGVSDRQFFLVWRKLSGREGMAVVDRSRCTLEMVRDFCLENKDDPDLYLKLNLPKMRVAAWKAHETMGTYKQVSNGG